MRAAHPFIHMAAFAAAVLFSTVLSAAGNVSYDAITVNVMDVHVPTVLGQEYNVVAEVCLECPAGMEQAGPSGDGYVSRGKDGYVLDGVGVKLAGIPMRAVRDLRLMYTGTMSAVLSRTTSYAMKTLWAQTGSTQMLYADPHYAIEQSCNQ